MGFFNRLTSQWIEVIEWLDPTQNTLVYRFPVNNQEIKMGAQLIVREGQAAVFINEGQLADVFGPGHYTLTTRNMPILTMLRSWKYDFNSPFKAEVYFVSTRQFTDLKWGTPNPVMMRDPEFGMVRLRAFGSYAIHIVDPAKFLKEIVGVQGLVETEQIAAQLRDMVVTYFSNALGQLQIAALDLAANYADISKKLEAVLAPMFQDYGVGLTRFLIENISLPPEVEQVLDKRTSMGIVGDMGRFTQFQAAQALEQAASNPGGSDMSAGLGIGAGLTLGQQLAQNLQTAQQNTQHAAQPTMNQPPAPAPRGVHDRLADLKALLDEGLINEEDFNNRKQQILSEV